GGEIAVDNRSEAPKEGRPEGVSMRGKIALDELQLYAIVAVQHGEGDERLHLGSARGDGTLIVLHEQNNGTECCGGRVSAYPLAAVISIQILPDAESLARAIEEDGIAPPG